MSKKTPRFRFYQGRPVKRLRRGPDGLIVTFLGPKGRPGEQIVVSQEDWDAHGEVREVPTPCLDELRDLYCV